MSKRSDTVLKILTQAGFENTYEDTLCDLAEAIANALDDTPSECLDCDAISAFVEARTERRERRKKGLDL